MRSSRVLLCGSVFAASLVAGAAGRAASVQILDVDGRMLQPFDPAGAASLVFFVSTDSPVSNSYAPEIQRMCREYGPRGVECSLMYEDVETAGTRLDEAVREQAAIRISGSRAVDRSRVIARRANSR